MKVIGFGCGPWRWYRGVGEVHMNKGRVGEERGGKEMDGCPLTVFLLLQLVKLSQTDFLVEVQPMKDNMKMGEDF
jgi:hypothetical protein